MVETAKYILRHQYRHERHYEYIMSECSEDCPGGPERSSKIVGAFVTLESAKKHMNSLFWEICDNLIYINEYQERYEEFKNLEYDWFLVDMTRKIVYLLNQEEEINDYDEIAELDGSCFTRSYHIYGFEDKSVFQETIDIKRGDNKVSITVFDSGDEWRLVRNEWWIEEIPPITQ